MGRGGTAASTTATTTQGGTPAAVGPAFSSAAKVAPVMVSLMKEFLCVCVCMCVCVCVCVLLCVCVCVCVDFYKYFLTTMMSDLRSMHPFCSFY